jgi:5'-nucleotidase
MMSSFPRSPLRSLALAATLALSLAACGTAPATRATPAEIHLVAINDFHGNLESSRFKYVAFADGEERTVQAGGIDTLAAAMQAWRAEDPQLLLVGAGDLVGASPALSSMWADEPTIAAMNMLGLKATSVGNHEFDHGQVELLRQQHGGCASPRPEACKYAPMYPGASFTYLAANVIDHATGKPFMPAYRIEESHGVRIAFIGTVLKNTASVALASGIAGLDFIDEADAVNRLLPELRAQGVKVFVVLIHQGGHTDDPIDQPDCQHLQGDIVGIVPRLDPSIRLVISGHSHRAYTCRVDGRLVTQADTAGHVLTRISIDLTADGAVDKVDAKNIVIAASAWPAAPAADAFLATVRARSEAALSRPVAKLAVAGVTREKSPAGESALGDLVADSMLAATRGLGAQIAFMNNGGLRRDLDAGQDKVTSMGQTQMVLPFGNTQVMMTLTGAQLRALLEQQWHAADEAPNRGQLQVSASLHYRWDASRPIGQRVLPDSLTVDGKPVADAVSYRIVTNNFLAEGGDRFGVFAQGGARVDTGIRDIDSLGAYLKQRDAAGHPAGAAQAGKRIELN